MGLDGMSHFRHDPDMPETDLIGTVEASTILGTSPRTIKRLAASGKLAVAQKMPGGTGAYLFRRADVEACRDERDQAAREQDQAAQAAS